MSWAYRQVPQVSIRSEAHLFKGVRQLEKSGKCISYVLLDAFLRHHNDLYMVFKVDKDNELFCVLDKDTPAHRVVVVDPSCIVKSGAIDLDTKGGQPGLLFVCDPRDLVVDSTEFTKNFDYTSFDLELRLLCHQRTKGHTTEVTPHGDLHTFHPLCDILNLV